MNRLSRTFRSPLQKRRFLRWFSDTAEGNQGSGQPNYKFPRKSFSQFVQHMKSKLVIGGVSLVGVTTVIYVGFMAWSHENIMHKKFEGAITVTQTLENYVTRGAVETKLMKILKPGKVDNFWILCGEHGIGKTSSVQKICKDIGKGIVYVNVPENINVFDLAFAEAIGFKNVHHGGIAKFIDENIYGREPLPGILTH